MQFPSVGLSGEFGYSVAWAAHLSQQHNQAQGEYKLTQEIVEGVVIISWIILLCHRILFVVWFHGDGLHVLRKLSFWGWGTAKQQTTCLAEVRPQVRSPAGQNRNKTRPLHSSYLCWKIIGYFLVWETLKYIYLGMKEIKLIENKASVKGVKDWVLKWRPSPPCRRCQARPGGFQQDKKVWARLSEPAFCLYTHLYASFSQSSDPRGGGRNWWKTYCWNHQATRSYHLMTHSVS